MNNQKCPKGARLVPLQNSPLFAIVDACDYDLVIRYRWKLDHKGYPYCHRGTLHLFLTQFVRLHEMMDHISTNRLDNRSLNFRPATAQQNCRNRNKQKPQDPSRHFTSRFKGVAWANHKSLWRARINFENRKKRHLGYFRTQEDAAHAYDEAVVELFGPFARTNKMMGLLSSDFQPAELYPAKPPPKPPLVDCRSGKRIPTKLWGVFQKPVKSA